MQPLRTETAENVPARPPQFGLRTLLAGVAVCSMLLAAGRFLGPAGAVLLAWFVVLAAAHILANAWGTRAARRCAGRKERDVRGDDALPLGVDPIGLAAPHEARQASPSHLSMTARHGGGTIAIVVAGAIAGAAAGCAAFSSITLGNPAWLGMLVGALSSGILGGLGGFLGSGFLRVGMTAAGEAVQSRNS